MPISKAQIKATTKYVKNNYDRIEIRLRKGKKEVIATHAAGKNESINQFITRAIDETMERDNRKRQTTEDTE